MLALSSRLRLLAAVTVSSNIPVVFVSVRAGGGVTGGIIVDVEFVNVVCVEINMLLNNMKQRLAINLTIDENFIFLPSVEVLLSKYRNC